MPSSSLTLNAPAIAEFLARAMRVEPTGGMTDLKACGRTTSDSVWPNVMPRLRAASPCPLGTVLMPERRASQMKAEV